jgi:hypothetical protein
MYIVISVPFIKGVGESNQLTIIGQCQKSLVNYVKSVNPNLILITLIMDLYCFS